MVAAIEKRVTVNTYGAELFTFIRTSSYFGGGKGLQLLLSGSLDTWR